MPTEPVTVKGVAPIYSQMPDGRHVIFGAYTCDCHRTFVCHLAPDGNWHGIPVRYEHTYDTAKSALAVVAQHRDKPAAPDTWSLSPAGERFRAWLQEQADDREWPYPTTGIASMAQGMFQPASPATAEGAGAGRLEQFLRHLFETRHNCWNENNAGDERQMSEDRFVEVVAELINRGHWRRADAGEVAGRLAKLDRIEAEAKADADDLAKMRDGTKLTRAGVVQVLAWQQEEIAETKAELTRLRAENAELRRELDETRLHAEKLEAAEINRE